MKTFNSSYELIRLRAYNAARYLSILLDRYNIKGYVAKNLQDEIQNIKFITENAIREEKLDP